MTGQPPTSDFYQLRRLAVKDVSGLLGFVIGFLGAMPCSRRHMTTDWLAGFVNRAVAHWRNCTPRLDFTR